MSQRFTLIELMIVIAIIAIIAAIAIPNLLEARKSGNETAAIGSLKAILTAQTIYKEKGIAPDGTARYGTLTELGQSKLIDAILGTDPNIKQGYEFDSLPALIEERRPYVFFASAAPVVPRNTGDRYFAVTQFGAIHFTLNESGASVDPNTGVITGGVPLGK